MSAVTGGKPPYHQNRKTKKKGLQGADFALKKLSDDALYTGVIMRIPAYPLITCNPFFSIWSKSERLFDSETVLWCGIEKRLRGHLTVDGKRYRFMGLSDAPCAKQTSLRVTPYVTYYTFEAGGAELEVRFFTPIFPDDLYLLSLPGSFITYALKSTDGEFHSVTVETSLGEEFCFDGEKKPIVKELTKLKNASCCCMGQKEQHPLSAYGDGVSADWGTFYLAGDECGTFDSEAQAIAAFTFLDTSDKQEGTVTAAFDDGYSAEYLGEKLKGLWTERFTSVIQAVEYCIDNQNELYAKALLWNERVINDAAPFGESYVKILTAAARQVLAAHILVRSSGGELLYLSKECHSNGCINTVDVTYPALPMFLLYNPVLVKAMLTGIFAFAKTPCWKFDFAPHDLGTYPLADGQVYALKNGDEFSAPEDRRKIYLREDDVFNFAYQMPVEESGNMIICSWAYHRFSNDRTFLERNFELLKRWADYLVKKGIVLDNQLCTDDFAGHSEKNVNLAIKSVVGVACFAEICAALGEDGANYKRIAHENAERLVELSRADGFMTFSIGAEGSWSLKYNMVWDKIFGLNLFSEELYGAESKKYREELNKYGVPLDYRAVFTKSDWMMWASSLDKTGENVKLFSECIVRFLEDTCDRCCFTDWFDTDCPKERAMDHRSVQAGLWMPLLKI